MHRTAEAPCEEAELVIGGGGGVGVQKKRFPLLNNGLKPALRGRLF